MIKVGIVGVRGFSVVGAMKAMPDEVKITAMCDLDEDCLKRAKDEIGLEESQCYRIYEDMLEKADIDAVVISTPMQCHVPQAILALQAGKHVMCEVTAAVTMDELWWLIENVEKSGKIYMYAENYCYMPELQLVRAMVKKGMFGEIYYGEGEYTHDCTELRNWHGKTGWRTYWQMGTRGAFYPTHSLGPVMQCFDDDRIVSISSFSPGNHNPYGLRNDDLTQTLCQLESGKLVKIRVDTISPRPHAIRVPRDATRLPADSAMLQRLQSLPTTIRRATPSGDRFPTSTICFPTDIRPAQAKARDTAAETTTLSLTSFTRSRPAYSPN